MLPSSDESSGAAPSQPSAIATVVSRRRELNELVHREFVRPIRVSSIDGEDEFAFWHALVRDVAYQQIPRSPRADKHVAAARWIEQTAGDRVADHAEILVYHYGEALDLARAAGDVRPDVELSLARYLVLAGDRACSSTRWRPSPTIAARSSCQSGRARAGHCIAKLAHVLVQRGERDVAFGLSMMLSRCCDRAAVRSGRSR